MKYQLSSDHLQKASNQRKSFEFYDPFEEPVEMILNDENFLGNHERNLDEVQSDGLHMFFMKQNGTRLSQPCNEIAEISEIDDMEESLQQSRGIDNFVSFEDQYHQMIQNQLGVLFKNYSEFKNQGYQIRPETNEFKKMKETIEEFKNQKIETKNGPLRKVKLIINQNLNQQLDAIDLDDQDSYPKIENLDFAPVKQNYKQNLEIIGCNQIFINTKMMQNQPNFSKEEIIKIDELFSDEEKEDEDEIINALKIEAFENSKGIYELENQGSLRESKNFNKNSQNNAKPPRRGISQFDSKRNQTKQQGHINRESYHLVSADARKQNQQRSSQNNRQGAIIYTTCMTPASVIESQRSRFHNKADPVELYHSNKLPNIPIGQTSQNNNSSKFMSKRQLQQNQIRNSNIFIVDQGKQWNPVIQRRDNSWQNRGLNNQQQGLSIIENRKYTQFVKNQWLASLTTVKAVVLLKSDSQQLGSQQLSYVIKLSQHPSLSTSKHCATSQNKNQYWAKQAHKMKMFGKKADEEQKEGDEGGGDKDEENADQINSGSGQSNQKDDGEGSVMEMRKGDYMIHVYVEKAKEICGEEDTSDPLIEVTCLNQKQYTSSKEGISNVAEVNWSEHLFLEPKDVTKQQAEDAQIVIRLMDKGFFKDTMIGLFEFNLSYVYLKKDHVLLHQWIAFSNPNAENYSKITGYLKVSISVACSGDEQVQIEEDDGVEGDDNVLMPPQLNPKFYQIKIRFFQAHKLPVMDMAIKYLRKAKTDAFLMTTYKNRKLKSKVVVMEENKDKDDPNAIDWNQEFWIPAQIPIIQPRLVIKVMDEDDIQDEVIGSLLFDVKDILENKYDGKFIWKNVYGSPLNQSNSQFKKDMNENPELASTWKGRILMQVTCEKCGENDSPLAKIQKISNEIVMQSRIFTKPREYAVIAEIGQGIALPGKQKYKVKLTIGGEEFITDEPKIAMKTNYCRWDHRFEERKIKPPYVNCEDFGVVIITLLDEKDKPICYYVDNINKYIYDPTKPVQYHWVSLKPDMCVGKVKDPKEAGMISFKLSLHDMENGPPNFKENKSWKGKPNIRGQSVRIRAYIYQCKDLPAADSNGTSDPYIVVWDTSEGKPKQTQVIEDNTNPLYFEVIEFEYEVRDINDLESYPPFILDLYDKDEGMFDSDDYLARAIIEPEDCAIVTEKTFDGPCKTHETRQCTYCIEERGRLEIPETPRWHPLKYSEGDPDSGQILVSFSVSSLSYTYVHDAPGVDLRALVNYEEFDVNMLILGLRNLQSPGILPVKKAFVNFNIKSLVPPNSSAVQNIRTQPKASGNNPTINTTMKFSIPLPTDSLYCPMLSCMVYDYIFKGWNQPMIGVFSVPIGELMRSLKLERKNETEIIQGIIDKLKEIDDDGEEYHPPSYKNSINITGQKSIHYDSDEDVDDEDRGSIVSGQSASLKDSQTDILKAKKKKKKQSELDDKVKIQKATKNSKIRKDVFEEFGANEAQGKLKAEEDHELQLLKIRRDRQASRVKRDAEGEGGGGFIMSKGNTAINSPRNSMSKKDMLKDYQEKLDQEKRLLEDDRIRAEEQLNAQGGDDAHEMIIMPKYELDKRLKVDREVQIPPKAMFLPLGWDEDRETKRKHYRQYFNDELELVKEIFPQESPFNTYDLKRGQTRGINSGGIFSMFKRQKKDESGQVSTIQCVGKFKGIIEIESRNDKEEYIKKKERLIGELQHRLNKISKQKIGEELVIQTELLGDIFERKKFQKKMRNLDLAHLEITKHLANLESDNILKRALLAQTKCLVRLYCIEAFDLSSRDNDSPSDPYLKITCNGKTFDERDNYQLDEPNPEFFQHFDFEGTFPGCSPLQIDIFDYDTIFGDDLIGTTIIDLEDRYFSMEWQALRDKPIEYRQIYHESSQISQGVIKCWCEITPVSLKPEFQPKLYDIKKEPPTTMEIRVCVFNATGVEIMDAEGTSDVFFKGFFDSKEDVQETDTHYRNQDGKPDFQYRLVYRIEIPRKKDYKFTLQCYDRDFFKSNDMIGEATLNLKQLVEDSKLTKAALAFNKNFYETELKPTGFQKLEFDKKDDNKFWLDMMYKDVENGGKMISRGRVRVQVDVLPADVADKNPVGRARQEPNHSPFLPQPEGRFELSLNPLKMYAQLIGPALRRKICMVICCIVCCALILAILPSVIANIGSKQICNLLPNGWC